MKFDPQELKDKLIAMCSEREADEIIGYLQKGIEMLPMATTVAPVLLGSLFEVFGSLKPIIERPKDFTTDLDIARMNKYIEAKLTRKEALALTIARMNRNTHLNIKNGSTASKCTSVGRGIGKMRPFAVDENSEVEKFSEALSKGMNSDDNLNDLDKVGHN